MDFQFTHQFQQLWELLAYFTVDEILKFLHFDWLKKKNYEKLFKMHKNWQNNKIWRRIWRNDFQSMMQ